MSVARGVQRDRPGLDPGSLARHEVAVHVEDDLVAVDVGVVVRRRDRFWVIVEQTGHERAHHHVRRFEGLMHRRGLVNSSRDRLEIVDGKRVRVQASVPADHIERVVLVHEPGGAGPGLDQYVDVLALDLEGLVGSVLVALAVRRALQELAIARQVATGRPDVSRRLHDERPHRLLCITDHPAVDRGRWNDHVVTRGERHGPERALQRAGARFDVHHLVTDGVLDQRAVLATGEVGDADVAVRQHGVTRGHGVAARLELMGAEVAWLEWMIRGELLVFDVDGLDRL